LTSTISDKSSESEIMSYIYTDHKSNYYTKFYNLVTICCSHFPCWYTNHRYSFESAVYYVLSKNIMNSLHTCTSINQYTKFANAQHVPLFITSFSADW